MIQQQTKEIFFYSFFDGPKQKSFRVNRDPTPSARKAFLRCLQFRRFLMAYRGTKQNDLRTKSNHDPTAKERKVVSLIRFSVDQSRSLLELNQIVIQQRTKEKLFLMCESASHLHIRVSSSQTTSQGHQVQLLTPTFQIIAGLSFWPDALSIPVPIKLWSHSWSSGRNECCLTFGCAAWQRI